MADYRTGTAQDTETTSAITAALLAYYTAAQVDALLGDPTASAQDTQTQATITGALLAYRTGPDQDVFTTNQITSALVAYRSAAALQHVEGRLVCLVGETRGQQALQSAMLLPCAATCPSVVARAAAVARAGASSACCPALRPALR